MEVGVQQYCVMLPWLFNLFMEVVVREVNAWVFWGEGQVCGLHGWRGLEDSSEKLN